MLQQLIITSSVIEGLAKRIFFLLLVDWMSLRETPSHPDGMLRFPTAFSLEIEGFIPEFFGNIMSVGIVCVKVGEISTAM